MNNKDLIWERIEDGGPTSVIVSDSEDICKVTTELLIEFKEKLEERQMLPVRIDCLQYVEPLVFFKEIFYKIWTFMTSKIQGETIMFKEMMDGALDTSMTDAIMEKFLQIVKDDNGLNILLIMENFDVVVSNQEEADLMKVRGMTSYVNMLTMSHKMLETLAAENNQEEYFCNQFKSYFI